MKFKKILVTGGAGFVGANLIRKLLINGYEVKVFDDFSTGKKEYLNDQNIEVCEGTILNQSEIEKSLKGCDSIIHLAAQGSVVDSILDPLSNFQVNGIGTFNVLNAAKNCNIKWVLFASTGGALMGNSLPPVNEKSLPKPISPYGASKLIGEGYCSAFNNSYELSTVICRFANVYGPFSSHKKGVVTKYIRSAINNEKITIFGDGESSRDYIYVDDLCEGIILAFEKSEGAANVYHLATGIETKITELANSIFDISKKEPRIEYAEKRQGEVERNFSTFLKAEKELGFSPEYNLKDGIASTYKWYLDNDKS